MFVYQRREREVGRREAEEEEEIIKKEGKIWTSWLHRRDVHRSDVGEKVLMRQ